MNHPARRRPHHARGLFPLASPRPRPGVELPQRLPEPAKDYPHYGEGGDEKPDASDQEKAEAIKRAKEQARESGEEASGKTGGESGGMASAY